MMKHLNLLLVVAENCIGSASLKHLFTLGFLVQIHHKNILQMHWKMCRVCMHKAWFVWFFFFSSWESFLPFSNISLSSTYSGSTTCSSKPLLFTSTVFLQKIHNKTSCHMRWACMPKASFAQYFLRIFSSIYFKQSSSSLSNISQLALSPNVQNLHFYVARISDVYAYLMSVLCLQSVHCWSLPFCNIYKKTHILKFMRIHRNMAVNLLFGINNDAWILSWNYS